MKLVYVVWEDATELDVSAWAEHEEEFVYVPVLCKQVGFLLYDGPEGIVITNGVIADGTVARRNQIPRGRIRRIEWLTEPSFLTEAVNE
jgi:hypothetical protein